MTAHPNHELKLWQSLLTNREKWQPLFRAAAECDPTDVTALAKLRKLAPLEYVRIVVEIIKARTKAVARHKFPPALAAQLVADAAGLEMASSKNAADYKAQRFRKLTPQNDAPPLDDLCCGIGADTMAFTTHGFQTRALDLNPIRTWMTAQNNRITNPEPNLETRTVDVTTLELNQIKLFHLDPSRRSESRNDQRAWAYADYQPGPDFIRRLIDHPERHGVVKLGPGINLLELPLTNLSSSQTEIEFISEEPHHRLTQALLWTGDLATDPGTRRATILPAQLTLAGTGHDCPPIAEAAEQYLHTFNPALERAQLLSQLCTATNLPLIHPSLGLLTSPRLQPHHRNPWLTASFELLAELPFHERIIKKWLRTHDAGIVEIKTRGQAVNPDQLQTQLRGKGSTTYTIFILRFDNTLQTLITRRCTPENNE